MSLKEVSLPSIAFKQYIYKLKGYSGLVYALIIAQLLGLLFSFIPNGSMFSGNEGFSISYKTFSADTVKYFSFAWIITLAALLTTRLYRNMEFSLVANRLSSHLSNIGFLLTASVFAGMTSTLMNVLVSSYYVFLLRSFFFLFGRIYN